MAARVTVVVPVLDERDTIEDFHARLSALGLAEAALYVDNASRDGTPEVIEKLGGRVLRHPRNLGYGASIRDGFARAFAAVAAGGDGADAVVVIDADLEYPPEAIPELVAALEHAPVVYGSRFRGPRPPEMPLLRRVGNRAVSGLFNRLFRQRTTDLYTGLKALRREAADRLALSRTGFEHVVEMGTQVAAAGFRIAEVPVVYVPRARGRSKMRHVPETAKCLALLIGSWLQHRASGGDRGGDRR